MKSQKTEATGLNKMRSTLYRGLTMVGRTIVAATPEAVYSAALLQSRFPQISPIIVPADPYEVCTFLRQYLSREIERNGLPVPENALCLGIEADELAWRKLKDVCRVGAGLTIIGSGSSTSSVTDLIYSVDTDRKHIWFPPLFPRGIGNQSLVDFIIGRMDILTMGPPCELRNPQAICENLAVLRDICEGGETFFPVLADQIFHLTQARCLGTMEGSPGLNAAVTLARASQKTDLFWLCSKTPHRKLRAGEKSSIDYLAAWAAQCSRVVVLEEVDGDLVTFITPRTASSTVRKMDAFTLVSNEKGKNYTSYTFQYKKSRNRTLADDVLMALERLN